jgi:hypothetical protein
MIAAIIDAIAEVIVEVLGRNAWGSIRESDPKYGL